MAKKATKTAKAPVISGLACVALPTAKFGETWRVLEDVLGGKGEKYVGEKESSGHVVVAGTTIVVGDWAETAEDPETGYPVRHGLATLYFATPNVDALYHALANRGASIVRGPLTTHWGAKMLTIRAGDAVLAFVEQKTKPKKRR